MSWTLSNQVGAVGQDADLDIIGGVRYAAPRRSAPLKRTNANIARGSMPLV